MNFVSNNLISTDTEQSVINCCVNLNSCLLRHHRYVFRVMLPSNDLVYGTGIIGSVPVDKIDSIQSKLNAFKI